MSIESIAYAESERDTVGAKMIALFTTPAKTFQLPIPGETEDSVITLPVRLKLLTDKENLEVAEIVDRYGLGARELLQRRCILARSLVWIGNGSPEMPETIRVAIKDRTGKDPSNVEQAMWVFENCQPVLLQILFRFYMELLEEQTIAVDEIKKKYELHLATSQLETKYSM